MKSLSSVLVRFFFSASLLALVSPAFSQRLNYWVGGTPGMENDWNCPKNWSAYQIPNDHSDVVIPDVSSGSRSNPVIQKGVAEVNSLFLDSNAVLNIREQATLVVYNGVHAVYPEDLKIKGLLLEWKEGPQKPSSDVVLRVQAKVNE
ncbi:MAG: hypothetical protein IPL49_08735 [Saprospirales bacterium]|nr:hypothetical protein [Saprospirales bacterium]MBK8490956.1 hypothetical protein [Saprospirales bacterium]